MGWQNKQWLNFLGALCVCGVSGLNISSGVHVALVVGSAYLHIIVVLATGAHINLLFIRCVLPNPICNCSKHRCRCNGLLYSLYPSLFPFRHGRSRTSRATLRKPSAPAAWRRYEPRWPRSWRSATISQPSTWTRMAPRSMTRNIFAPSTRIPNWSLSFPASIGSM